MSATAGQAGTRDDIVARALRCECSIITCWHPGASSVGGGGSENGIAQKARDLLLLECSQAVLKVVLSACTSWRVTRVLESSLLDGHGPPATQQPLATPQVCVCSSPTQRTARGFSGTDCSCSPTSLFSWGCLQVWPTAQSQTCTSLPTAQGASAGGVDPPVRPGHPGAGQPCQAAAIAEGTPVSDDKAHPSLPGGCFCTRAVLLRPDAELSMVDSVIWASLPAPGASWGLAQGTPDAESSNRGPEEHHLQVLSGALGEPPQDLSAA